GTVCVVGKIRDLILQLSKSSIYSTKPVISHRNITI
ncbi:PTS fructose IIA subunit, partial [Escherichia coli]